MSASGQYQVACVFGGNIYISSDFGNTWIQDTKIGTIINWRGVAISASGQYISAVNGTNNDVYKSNNFGNSWSTVTTSGGLRVAISASGQYQCTLDAVPWRSSDYGATWTAYSSVLNGNISGITISASGQLILIVCTDGNMYTSTNYGQNFGLSYSSTAAFNTVSMSSSGQYITACVSTGQIYNCVNNNSGNAVITVGSYAGTASGVTGVAGSLYYDTTSTAGASALKISTGSAWQTVKSFVIDHPIDTSKYLVHGCLEGPEAGVYYRGKDEITDGFSLTIELPSYVSKLAKNLSIQISAIYDGGELKTYNVSTVNDNKFTVYGPNGKFYWIVHGTRAEFTVEPSKHNTIVKGSGPYRWI